MKAVVIAVIVIGVLAVAVFAPIYNGRVICGVTQDGGCWIHKVNLIRYIQDYDHIREERKQLDRETNHADDDDESVSDSESGVPIALSTLDEGAYSGLNVSEPKRLVVDNDADWRQLWSEHNNNKLPIPGRPEIDFSKHTVLAVFAGVRGTGGTNIEITEVRDVGERVEVQVHTTSSGRGCMTTAAFSHPYHIVAADVVGEDIVFIDTNEVINCE